MNDSQRPGDRPGLPISQDELIDRLADAFERRWKAGDRTAIEEYLGLTHKLRETRRGRAELRLAERAAAYTTKPDSRHLPGWFEWPNVLLFTRRKNWTPPERRLMRAATKRRLFEAGVTAVLIPVAIVAGLAERRRVVEAQERTVAEGVVSRLLAAPMDEAARIAEQLPSHRRYADPELRRVLAEPEGDATDAQRLRAAVGLLGVDDAQAERVYDALLAASFDEARVLIGVLDGHKAAWIERLWRTLTDDKAPDQARLRAAMALAAYEPPGQASARATVPERWENAAGFIVDQWLAEARQDPSQYEPLSEAFAPVAKVLLAPLAAVFRDRRRNATERDLATSILAHYAADSPVALVELAIDGEADQFLKLFSVLEKRRDAAAGDALKAVVSAIPSADLKPIERVALGQRRAGAAVALVRQGERDTIFPALRVEDDPEARTQFVYGCRARGVTPAELLECVQRSDDLRRDETGAARRAGGGVLYGLLLALGEFDLAELPESQRDSLIEQLAAWYADDRSSAVHGAAGWLLRQWGQDELAKKVDQTPMPYTPDREWFTLRLTVPPQVRSSAFRRPSGAGEADSTDETPPEGGTTNQETPPEGGISNANNIYMTFVVMPAGEYTMGSPAGESEGRNDQARHSVRITRPYAVLDREITWTELEAFSQARFAGYREQLRGGLEHAGAAVNWYDAIRFCRWLSERADIKEEDQSYPDPERLDANEFPPDPDQFAEGAPQNWPLNLEKTGFRLPTEAEWEIAARSGMRSNYGFGNDVSLLRHYGWFLDNSDRHAHEPRRLRPNARGLFDMHGNVYEWCHDWYGNYAVDAAEAGDEDPTGPAAGSSRVSRGGGWDYGAESCRSANRRRGVPSVRNFYLGFRVALVPFSQVDKQAEATGGTSE